MDELPTPREEAMSEKDTPDNEKAAGPLHDAAVNRRDAFRGLAAAAATAAAGVGSPAQAADQPTATCETRNPYGGGPNTGITLPPYYRPTPSVANANTYFPGMEELGSDEMRISFVGSTPVPPTRAQAGTAIMVELGNGKRFFFDLGPGCLRNLVAMQVPLQMVNDIFITHLHVDHYAELPYIFAFAPWMGRWKPLRVNGPSGRTPQDGIKYMIEGMKMMTRWHTDSFNCLPMGDGTKSRSTNSIFVTTTASATTSTASSFGIGDGRMARMVRRLTASTGTVFPSCGPATAGRMP